MAGPVLAGAAKKAATRILVTKATRSRRSRGLLVAVAIAVLLAPLFLLMGLASMMLALFTGASGGAAQAQTADCAGLADQVGGIAEVGGLDIPGVGGAAASVSQLGQDQLQNAQVIVQVGRQLNVPPYGWVVALATAMQESTLRNLDYGDRDSLGLFQQRANWGSSAERTDPVVAATMFYSGGSDAPDGVVEDGLLQIEGWEQMSVTAAAQAVQISAFPSAYAQWEPLARALAGQLGGVQDVLSGECGWPPGLSCPPSPWPELESGLTSDARLVLRCLHQEFPEVTTMHTVGERPAGGDGDHANGRAVDAMLPFDDYQSTTASEYGWQMARWAQDNHDRLGVKYIIFDDKIWSVARAPEGWRDYTHYDDCTTDTCLHYDHVHISVYGNAARLPDTGDWVLPLQPGSYALTARFGECGGRWENCHTGLDFAAPTGEPVRAAAQGVVVFAGWNGPYGNSIKVDHGHGVTTTYSHLAELSQSTLGKSVIPGQLIGTVGSTGNSTGPHLHFEVHLDGNPMDPEQWLSDHGVAP